MYLLAELCETVRTSVCAVRLPDRPSVHLFTDWTANSRSHNDINTHSYCHSNVVLEGGSQLPQS